MSGPVTPRRAPSVAGYHNLVFFRGLGLGGLALDAQVLVDLVAHLHDQGHEAGGVGLLDGADGVAFELRDVAGLAAGIAAVRQGGAAPIVRVPLGDFAMVSRVLDFGAEGVIAPMINTVEDARRFGAFMKFPPLGERSWGPHGATSLSGLQPNDYFARANGFSLGFAMVETREALAITDEILGTPGIDGIFIGPSDLSIALTNGATVDPLSAEVDKALNHALDRARAANKLAAVFAHTGERRVGGHRW